MLSENPGIFHGNAREGHRKENWEETRDQFILLLSSEDFSYLECETILSNEKPVEVLRDS